MLNDRMPSFFMLFCWVFFSFEPFGEWLWRQWIYEFNMDPNTGHRSAKWLPCQMRFFKFHESWTAAASMFYLEISMTQLPWSFSLPLPADFYLVSTQVKPPNQTRVDNCLEMHILALKLSALSNNTHILYKSIWCVFIVLECLCRIFMDIPWFL